jgi:hypothetical protein
VKRGEEVLSRRHVRFTGRVVSLLKKPSSVIQIQSREGENGYRDWVIVAIHGLRE